MNKRLIIIIGLVLGFVLLIVAVFVLGGNTSKQQTLINTQDRGLPKSSRVSRILPYYSTYYELQYQPNGSNIPSVLFTYLPPPSYDPVAQNNAPSEAQAESSAKLWLAQNNINPNSYKFVITGPR